MAVRPRTREQEEEGNRRRINRSPRSSACFEGPFHEAESIFSSPPAYAILKYNHLHALRNMQGVHVPKSLTSPDRIFIRAGKPSLPISTRIVLVVESVSTVAELKVVETSQSKAVSLSASVKERGHFSGCRNMLLGTHARSRYVRDSQEVGLLGPIR